MAVGAASSDRTVQYCMPLPSEVLSAAAYPAVTNARATGDYFHANDQWAVGSTSLFYWAIGILPFKDGFYSSNNKQVGGQTGVDAVEVDLQQAAAVPERARRVRRHAHERARKAVVGRDPRDVARVVVGRIAAAIVMLARLAR